MMPLHEPTMRFRVNRLTTTKRLLCQQIRSQLLSWGGAVRCFLTLRWARLVEKAFPAFLPIQSATRCRIGYRRSKETRRF